MIIGESKPSLEELHHFGILGMHWGNRKVQPGPIEGVVSNRVPITTQVGHAVLHRAGVEATRVLLRKYGGTAIRASGKAAVKGARFLFEGEAPKGSDIVLRLLGSTAKNAVKVAGKGGKAYLKTAIAIGKLGLKSR